MSVLAIKPGKNLQYAYYLMGFGVGIFVGGLVYSVDKFPVVTSVTALVLVVLSLWVEKQTPRKR